MFGLAAGEHTGNWVSRVVKPLAKPLTPRARYATVSGALMLTFVCAGARALLRTGCALMLTFCAPHQDAPMLTFGAPFQIVTAKRAAFEWTGTSGKIPCLTVVQLQ